MSLDATSMPQSLKNVVRWRCPPSYTRRALTGSASSSCVDAASCFDLDPTVVLVGSAVFTEFKGALTEQYVCQKLVASCGFEPYCRSAENSSGRIGFLM